MIRIYFIIIFLFMIATINNLQWSQEVLTYIFMVSIILFGLPGKDVLQAYRDYCKEEEKKQEAALEECMRTMGKKHE